MKKKDRSIIQSVQKDLKKGVKRIYWYLFSSIKYYFLTIKFYLFKKEIYINKISLLLPSRERSKKFERMLNSLKKNCYDINRIEILLLLDEDEKEIQNYKQVINNIFPEINIEKRGFRTPLGHKGGLKGEFKLLDIFKRLEIKYVSSDLRDVNNSLHPKLVTEDGTIRQPYRYENGMLEIPAIGWQDTAFSGTSSTKLFESPPTTFDEIIEYYGQLFSEGKKLSEKIGRDIFLGLVLHPYDVSFYDKENLFFGRLKEQLEKCDGTFHTYGEVSAHYHNN